MQVTSVQNGAAPIASNVEAPRSKCVTARNIIILTGLLLMGPVSGSAAIAKIALSIALIYGCYLYKTKPVSTPAVAPKVAANERVQAQAYLDSLWVDYKKGLIIHHNYYSSFFGFLDSDHRNPKCIKTDHPLCDLVSPFENDPEAFFIPSFDINVATIEGRNELKKALEAAFKVGKKMVVTRLGNGRHGIASVFLADGTFKIIDTWFNNSVDMEQLRRELSLTKGEYINTHLQQGGEECARLSTLYCYQMAKKKDPNAYQEVNGAFLEGRLQTFEDYRKIDGAPRIADMSGKRFSYTAFTKSWDYRYFNFTVDCWRDLTLRKLLTSDDEFSGAFNYFPLMNDPYKFPYLDREDHFDMSKLREIPLPANALELPLKSFLSLNPQEQRYLLVDPTKTKFRLFVLKPGQTL